MEVSTESKKEEERDPGSTAESATTGTETAIDSLPKAKKRGRVTFSEGAEGEEARKDAPADKDEQEEPWSEPLHRSFVGAVLEVGLQHASPAVIMQGMHQVPSDVTSERVKSHLQKYRKNKDKNKEDFLEEYDAWMRHAKRVGSLPDPTPATAHPPGTSVAPVRQPSRLHAGDQAASLSWSVLNEGKTNASASPSATVSLPHTFQPSMAKVDTKNQQSFSFAIPTEAELATPLGASIAQLLAVFPPMVQCLMDDREANREMTITSSHPPPDAASSQSGPIGTVVSAPSSNQEAARRQLEKTPIRALADSATSLRKDDGPASPPRKDS
jgi:SHAQKYF class myb-like DNA-binding protein